MLKRVIGIVIIVLAVVIVLSLLPRHGSNKQVAESTSIPVVAVPVGSTSASTSRSVGSSTMAGATSAQDTIDTQAVQHANAADSTANAALTNRQTSAATAGSGNKAAPAAAPARQPAADKTPANTPDKAAPAPPTTVRYYVQVGSFGDKSNADDVHAKLQKLGFKGRILEAVVDGKTVHRVQVGPYPDEAGASSAQHQLVTKGYKGSRVIEPQTPGA